MKSTVYITGKAELSQVERGKQDASSCEDPVLFVGLCVLSMKNSEPRVCWVEVKMDK